MLVRFTDANGQTLCFRHAVLAAARRGETIRASVGEATEVDYTCPFCDLEKEQIAHLARLREQRAQAERGEIK